MLLLNKKEFNLDDPINKAELNAFLKAVPEFNERKALVVKFDKRLVSWDKVNQKENKPENIGLPAKQVIQRDGKGSQIWVWCKHYEAHQETGAILIRTPWNINLTGTMTIPWKEKDLAFFLFISTMCGNGENPVDRDIKYVFEDREGEAREKLNFEKVQARVKSKILNDEIDGGTTDKKIRELSSAYQIPSGLGIMETRNKLFEEVTRDGVNGYTHFLNLLDNPEERDRKILILKAKEAGFLKCLGHQITKEGNQCWKIFNRDQEVVRVFAIHRKVNNGVTDHDAFLSKALKQDPSLYEEIQSIIEAKVVEV